MNGGDLKERELYQSATVFKLLLWPHHVDHKGVVSSVEASDGDARGKKDGQNEVEVGDEGHKETK